MPPPGSTASAVSPRQAPPPPPIVRRPSAIMSLNVDATREFRVQGHKTRFTGRRETLELLYNAIRDAATQKALVVVPIVGPAGVGKTRLIHEFLSLVNLEQRGITLLSTRGTESEPDLSLRPVSDLVRQRFALESGLDAGEVRERIRRGLLEIVGEKKSADATMLLSHLVGVPNPEGSRSDVMAFSDAALERALQTFYNLVRFDASRRPHILVVDALQWSTTRLRQALAGLAKCLAGTGTLVLLASRQAIPPDVLGAVDPRRVRSISVEPFDPPTMARLVAQLMEPAGAVQSTLLERMVQRSKGIPALAEDIVRLMFQRGALALQPGAPDKWVLDLERLKGARLPGNAVEAAKARIDTLDEKQRAAIELASVFGRTFFFGGVLALMRLERDPQHDRELSYWTNDRREARLNQVLLGLQSADLIEFCQSAPIPKEVAFDFQNANEQQRLYEGIAPEKRALYHRVAAQWMVAAGAMDTFEGAELCAVHFERGGRSDLAGDAFRRAAALARFTGQHHRAAELLEKAVTYYDASNLDARYQAAMELADALVPTGELARAREACADALYYSTVLGRKALGGRAYHRLGQVAIRDGRYDEAREHLDRALKLLTDAGDLAGIACCHDELGLVAWYLGRPGAFREALAQLLKGLGIRRKLGDEVGLAVSLRHVGNIHIGRGQLDEAEKAFREAIAIHERRHEPWGVAMAEIGLGAVFHELGRLGEAIGTWEHGLEKANEAGDRELQGVLQTNLGEARLGLGHDREAEALLQSALEATQEVGDRRTMVATLRNQATMYAVRKRFERAIRVGEEAVQVAEALDAKQPLGAALVALGNIYADMNRVPATADTAAALGSDTDQRANECFFRAVGYFEEMGDVRGLSRGLESYGRFLTDRGVVNKGRRLMQRAQELRQGIGAAI